MRVPLFFSPMIIFDTFIANQDAIRYVSTFDKDKLIPIYDIMEDISNAIGEYFCQIL